MYFLTIISPFYNSEEKSKRLLNTLLSIDDKNIEIIFVDDGSSDNTVTALTEFKENSCIDVNVIKQDNKGPGGARNTGLKAAKGKYIWFVDSDDDIKTEAISYIKSVASKNYDFVDFNYNSNSSIVNSMELEAGIYEEDRVTPELLFYNFGLICTKVLNRDFLIKNEIYYPEYCIYEDGPLMVYIYPFLCKKFIKSDIVGYVHQVEYTSITRTDGTLNSRYFDRLYASIFGYKKGVKLASSQEHIKVLNKRFVSLYLLNPVGVLRSIVPSRNWLLTYRVMRQYRTVAKELNIEESPVSLFTGSKKFKSYFLFHWYLSFLLFQDQTKFFEENRYRAWHRPFSESTKLSSNL